MSASSQQKDTSLAEWEIADPGSGAAIPNELTGLVKLVSTTTENRSLADPVRVGQKLTLNGASVGGAITIVAASDINETGNTTMAISDAGEHIILESMYSAASTLQWRVTSNDGVSLS